MASVVKRYRITVPNPKPLDMVDAMLFRRWGDMVREALSRPGPLNVPSWGEYRRQAS